EVAADRLVGLVPELLDPDRGALGGVVAQADPAEADALHALPLEVLQPGVVPAGVLGAALLAGVPQPQLDVLGGVLDVALDHPAGAARAGDPLADPVPPVLAVDVQPVAEQLAPAAVGEVPRGLADQLGDDRV